MLIHFLAKSCWSLSIVVAHIVWDRIQSGQLFGQTQEILHLSLSASSRKSDIMNTTEEKQAQQAVTSHKGLLQRRSFHNLTEDIGTRDLESAAMSRQGSNQSQMSSASFDLKDEQIVAGQPNNFGTVVPGVYRSSYPQEADYPFIQELELKTIM